MIIISKTTDEVKMMIQVTSGDIGSVLKAVGTISAPVALEEPTVESPDEANGAHWTPIVYGSDTYALDDQHPMQVIQGALGAIRVNKPSGDDLAVHWVRS